MLEVRDILGKSFGHSLLLDEAFLPPLVLCLDRLIPDS
jgi:hypothetical protein